MRNSIVELYDVNPANVSSHWRMNEKRRGELPVTISFSYKQDNKQGCMYSRGNNSNNNNNNTHTQKKKGKSRNAGQKRN